MNGLLSNLEKAIDYKFQDQALLETALTHRSFAHGNNERFEYLGDAALGFIIADAIFRKFPQATEGELTRLRSSLVKGETLAKLGRELELGDYIKLGPESLAQSTSILIWKFVENASFHSINNYFQTYLPIRSVKIPKPACRNYYSHED
jgi:dsRNA-specific ribonuclease